MDTGKLKTSVTLTPDEAAMAQARGSADKARRIAVNDALNRIQPVDNLNTVPVRH